MGAKVTKKERYYYKAKSGNGYLSLKSPSSEAEAKKYVEISEHEWNNHLASIQPQHHEPTAADLAKKEIAQLKHEIASTDYVACKLAERETEEEKAALREEYATVLARRKAIRVRINELESSL